MSETANSVQPAACSVPAGMMLVPRQPTPAMLRAASDGWHRFGGYAGMWRAMLDAVSSEKDAA